MTKFDENRTKIVDSLVVLQLWFSVKFFHSVSNLKGFKVGKKRQDSSSPGFQRFLPNLLRAAWAQTMKAFMGRFTCVLRFSSLKIEMETNYLKFLKKCC